VLPNQVFFPKSVEKNKSCGPKARHRSENLSPTSGKTRKKDHFEKKKCSRAKASAIFDKNLKL
jgi:hypothetical protein